MDGLKAAATEEADAVRHRLERYEALTKKIVDYQAGKGGAPSVDNFLEWRADVEISLAIRGLGAQEAAPLDFPKIE